MKLIDVQEVFFKYPGAKTDTIQGAAFTVEKGEILGFLGPSGAGKSTLQKILTGVLREYRGSVRVFGKEMKNRTADYYEAIGVDFEFPNFYGKFTALQNLQYFASLYGGCCAEPVELLRAVGLESHGDKKVSNFSKGMKMRLGFVRCLLHNPSLLFLDEPTSGLDPANARTLKDMILRERDKGKTVILTTHNMHDAGELCDRVAFIADGKIKALDTPRALCKGDKATKVVYRYLTGGQEREESCLLSALGDAPSFRQAIKDGTLRGIHSKEQTLEDVFIALTGRCLQ